MTLAPGKKDPHAQTGSWDRDLGADLDRLRVVYRTDVLVSLLEDRELDFLGIPNLVAAAQVCGIEVVRFPIPDGHPPEPVAARRLVRLILEALDAGRVVVVHCRGGLGRAGTIAAATLIESGLSVERATAVVRAARGGTIETPSQVAFLRRWSLDAGP
jgi:protein-tyrosine phosphatase